jgi:hypothetical protein
MNFEDLERRSVQICTTYSPPGREMGVMEDKDQNTYEKAERRSETRKTVDQYRIVEFSVEGLAHLYQFKIWNISPLGIGVLVMQGSEVLKHLKVGDILNMKYYRQELSEQPEQLKTEIKHITKDAQERFRGNYLVGLSILEK